MYSQRVRELEFALVHVLRTNLNLSEEADAPTVGAEGPGFKSQPRRCRVAVLGKLFTPIVPLVESNGNLPPGL